MNIDSKEQFNVCSVALRQCGSYNNDSYDICEDNYTDYTSVKTTDATVQALVCSALPYNRETESNSYRSNEVEKRGLVYLVFLQ